jgi:predicted extracellular nuclease
MKPSSQFSGPNVNCDSSTTFCSGQIAGSLRRRPRFDCNTFLAQTFQDNLTREKFSVVVNHLKSKGCGGASGADADQGDGQGCYNARRVAQVTLLLSFINGKFEFGLVLGQ